MTDMLLDGLAADDRAELPVMALNDLVLTHTRAAADVPPRIDVAHRDRPEKPLLSLDPADASTLMARLAEQIAGAWVHADERRQRIEERHDARGLDGDLS